MAGVGRWLSERFLSAFFGSLLVILLAEHVSTTSAEDGHCIWYGQCANAGEVKKLNCAYNGTAKPIQPEAMPLLNKYCPDIVAGGVSCCDKDQLVHLDQQTKLVRTMLEGCPCCWNNFVKHICAMTCGPTHSLFLEPVEYEKYNDTERVKAVDFHLNMDYMEGTYNACSQVPWQTGEGYIKVMDVLCADTTCSPKKWFDFMGEAEGNPYVPFQINYKQTPLDGRPPLNPTVTPCNFEIEVGCIGTRNYTNLYESDESETNEII